MNKLTEAEGALAAMNRAAAAARLRASRFGSRLALWEDGAVVLISPLTNYAEQAGTGQPATSPQSKPEDGDKTST
ncbi:MAG: hypothetical protein HC767_05655 [Akkermansiaceae bacterium]|nr:hypothetical protein [Akkermansiaceae bacterium]